MSTTSTFQKVLLCLFAAMAVVFGIWTAVSRANSAVEFCDTLLTIDRRFGETVYSGTLYGSAVTITCRGENGAKIVNFEAPGHYSAACRVEFPEGTITTEFGKTIGRIRIIRNDKILFSGGYDPNPTGNAYMHYFNEDGSWEPLVTVHASGSGDPWHFFEFHVHDIMRFAKGPALSVRGSWGAYFLALFITILGALLTAFPNEFFYLKYFRYVQDPEPTELFYILHKFGVIILAVTAFFIYCNGISMIV